MARERVNRAQAPVAMTLIIAGSACRRTSGAPYRQDDVAAIARDGRTSTAPPAANCAATVDANDAMPFDIRSMNVPHSRKTFTDAPTR